MAHKKTRMISASHFEPHLANFPLELSERTNIWSGASVQRQSHQLQRSWKAQVKCPVACPKKLSPEFDKPT